MAVTVVSAVDATYLPFTAVVAASIAAHCSAFTRVDYHVLYDGPDDETVRLLRTARLGRVRMHLHSVTNPLAGSRQRGHVSAATLLRFKIPSVLTDARRAIYLDADVIVRRDLRSLFSAPLHGRALGGVPDLAMRLEAERLDRLGDTALSRYFTEVVPIPPPGVQAYINAGVLLMDLQKLREVGFEKRATELMRHRGDQLIWRDQDAINLLMSGDIAHLDPRWNVMVTTMEPSVRFTREDSRRASALQRAKPYILHFTAGRKPWSDPESNLAEVWWHYARRSLVADLLADSAGYLVRA